MARFLSIRLHDGGKVVMQADGPEEAMAFCGLAELMSLTSEAADSGLSDAELVPPDAMPEGRHVFRDQSLTEIAYAPDWSRVLIAGWKKRPRRPHYYNCCIWQATLNCACMNAALRGEDAVLAHCAVLETERGVVLLFGESGMGKSTAFGRWRAAGRKGVSDDMALLDFSGGDGVVRVRRMPTWSACREERNEWNYSAGEELLLAGILALGRSESGRDEIVEINPAQYFAQCYRSMFYWNLFYAKELPEERKKLLKDRILRMTETITRKYAPRALLTVPESGELAELIEAEL